MNPLRHLTSIPIDEWPQLYQRALAAGSGLTIDPELERVSAAGELVALTLPELVRLAALALIADGPDWPQECARAARQDAAAVLRLLDRALLAHGRDAGYTIDAWREHASSDPPDEARGQAATAHRVQSRDRPGAPRLARGLSTSSSRGPASRVPGSRFRAKSVERPLAPLPAASVCVVVDVLRRVHHRVVSLA